MTTLTEIYSNFSQTTLAAGVGVGATSLTVLPGSGSLFPNPSSGQFFRITLNDVATGNNYETMWVTSRNGDTFSGILRGQEGTSVSSWATGDKVYEAPSAGAMSNLTQQIQVQSNTFTYSQDTGSANVYVINPTPANFATPIVGAILYFTAAHPNTGQSTITINGGSTYPLYGMTRTALQGGEISTYSAITYDPVISGYILLWSTGGNVVTITPTKGNHTVNLSYLQANYAQINGSATQPFQTSTLQTNSIATISNASLTIYSNNGLVVTNSNGTTYEPIVAGNGVISPTSQQVVTGNQLYKTGEVRMWHGAVANITATWGPGWQLADGTNGTADLRDKFIVGAGNFYASGQIGGAASVVLNSSHLPAHTHTIGDPGHGHIVNDPTHVHPLVDPGHSHYIYADQGWPFGIYSSGVLGSANSDTDQGYGYASNNATGVYMAAAPTGVTLNASVTGITGTNIAGYAPTFPFSIIPPYFSLCYIEYIGH